MLQSIHIKTKRPFRLNDWNDQNGQNYWSLLCSLNTRGQALNEGTDPWRSVHSHTQPPWAGQPPVVPNLSRQALNAQLKLDPRLGWGTRGRWQQTWPLSRGTEGCSLLRAGSQPPMPYPFPWSAGPNWPAARLPQWQHHSEGRRSGGDRKPSGGSTLKTMAWASGVFPHAAQ